MNSSPLRRPVHLIAVLAILLACLLKWGARILVAEGALPSHVDCAVVLQGSMTGEKARLAGAIELVRRGIADQLLLSIPEKGFWDQDIQPVAIDYLKTRYGGEITTHIVFCQTGPQVDSTEREADVLAGCIREHGWRNVTVVTSDYHTRRAGIIWRRVIRKQDPQTHISVRAVSDPEFNADRWWAERTSAKTWLMESIKLITAVL
jgi:hypothetical protein